MVRLLHAADLHLGLRVTRFEEDACNRVGEARFIALQQLREKAAQLRADFILVAGDILMITAFRALRRPAPSRSWKVRPALAPCISSPVTTIRLFQVVFGTVTPGFREQPHLRVHFLRKPEPVAVPGLP